MRLGTQRFAEQGFHPTTVADIIDDAGVGKGVFYWYFSSKDQLLLDILAEALHDLRTSQKAALMTADGPLERLELGIRATLGWYANNPDILKLVTFGRTEERFAVALERGRAILTADTAQHITAAIDAGLIASGDPWMMATAVRGLTDELGRSYLVAPHDAATAARVADQAVRMCLSGLLGTNHQLSSGSARRRLRMA